MKKIAGLYQNYLRETEEEFQEFHARGYQFNELKHFLKNKLSADDYLVAEELMNSALSETEETGFAAGCKYTSGLARELFTE